MRLYSYVHVNQHSWSSLAVYLFVYYSHKITAKLFHEHIFLHVTILERIVLYTHNILQKPLDCIAV